MSSLWLVAGRGSYADFLDALGRGVFEEENLPAERVEILSRALTNGDAQARLLIANRLLDDGADASVVLEGSERINVFHVLWGGERERDVVGEAALVGRLLDGGADINYRSRRFGLPLVMLVTQISAPRDYLRAVFAAITEHGRPDLEAPVDRQRSATVGSYLAYNKHAFMRDEVLAYARASGQDLTVIDQPPPPPRIAAPAPGKAHPG